MVIKSLRSSGTNILSGKAGTCDGAALGPVKNSFCEVGLWGSAFGFSNKKAFKGLAEVESRGSGKAQSAGSLPMVKLYIQHLLKIDG